ncbi:hypothetical protein CKO35_03965 [Ectothiorhodospira shaposhnikovii]|uniref:hypothetical protein n=1 Tax=Ectothiorhodospira shaposhnikovii TaxID=1054 RepID=UPI001907866D|nr:hypothetical protein [Ectothiorhodospira shaposhnikovii]MBK1672464.1 hypothetical protein [Ectothiorhodospira shaposhnikovii]
MLKRNLPVPSRHDPKLDFLSITEVSNGGFFAGELFQRKFGHAPPDYPRHLVAFYRNGNGEHLALGYLHLLAMGNVVLVGGACTDDRVLRRMSRDERQQLKMAGGVMFNLLRHAFTHYPEYIAFFGNVGNPQAEAVDLRAGFVHTHIPRLLVYFPRPLSRWRRQRLINQVARMGTF